MYQYWGFGLHINAEIEFPELLPKTFDNPDLEIKIGITPTSLKEVATSQAGGLNISPTEYLLKINNVGNYYAAGGRLIIIEPFEDADIESVRLFMLSNAMAAILHQQHKIPFHASGIITPKGLNLFTGPSGIGKSTIALSLMNEGYELFTDDVCVLHNNISKGNIEAIASYPMMKLWENTIDQVSAIGLNKNHKLRPHINKYGIFQHQNFYTGALPVTKIFALSINDHQEEFSCKKLSNLEAFTALQQNTYRREQVSLMQLHQTHFNMISHLVTQVITYEVTRPGNSTISSFTQFLKEYIE